MEPDESETRSFTVPPPQEEESELATAGRRTFGAPPAGLAAVLAAFSFGAGIVLLIAGITLIGVVLVVAAVLLAALFADQALRRGKTGLDRMAAAAVDQTRAVAGLTASSVRSWTSTGRQLARLRLEANRLARQRSRLLYAYGAAVYAGNDAEAERLRAALVAVDERFAACASEANAAVERMRYTQAEERLAVAPTQIREPDNSP